MSSTQAFCLVTLRAAGRGRVRLHLEVLVNRAVSQRTGEEVLL